VIFDVLGVAGVLMVLSAYFLLVAERMRESGPLYLGANILGSSLILVSLAHHFNLAATVMQATWIAITLVGVIFKKTRNNKN
jgi:hypothetical protein